MTIGLISDTHSYLDPKIAAYFESCQEIWHAGDIGNLHVLEQLKAIKPTYAVYGNIDDQQIRLTCPRDLWLDRNGLKILITHIAGNPKRYDRRIKQILASEIPDILVCGHSHILKVVKDPVYRDMLFINPGAAGRQGFHHKKTIMRLTLNEGRVANLEVIELGKRGALQV